MKTLHKPRITSSEEMVRDKVREIFKRVKDKLDGMASFDNIFGLEFAYAGIPSGYVRDAERPAHEIPNVMYFDVGPLPKKGTPARSISEWEDNIDVLYPHEITKEVKGSGKKFITVKDAQLMVKEILNSDGACHEYIAYQAAKLVAREEATRHTLHIMLGAQAEDYIFKRGETLKNIYAKPPTKVYKNREEYARDIVPHVEREVPGFIKGVFIMIARLWKNLTGSIEDDAINRPYMAHFYDPTRDADDMGLNVANGEIKFQSALDRLKDYWSFAANLYLVGKKAKAFTALGHMVHLISDMCVPAHVHNDIHGPTILLGKLDSLEQWAKRRDYMHLQRGDGKMNITIWDSGPLAPPVPDQSWTPENINQKLVEFVNRVVVKTQEFKSVDAPGTAPGQLVKGKLNDDECYMQAQTLIPQAIQSSAQLIVNFIDYVKRLESETEKKRDELEAQNPSTI